MMIALGVRIYVMRVKAETFREAQKALAKYGVTVEVTRVAGSPAKTYLGHCRDWIAGNFAPGNKLRASDPHG